MPGYARTDEELALGILRLQFGTTIRDVPTLKMSTSPAWKERVATSIGTQIGGISIPGKGGADTLIGMLSLTGTAMDTIRDLVIAYDITGALGGRAWLDDHADDQQVYVAFRRMLAVHFPFVSDVVEALTELRRLMALAEEPTPTTTDESSPSESSSSGASTTGGSPTPST